VSRRPLSLQVRDSSTKEVRFSGKNRRAKAAVQVNWRSESTGKNIWRPPWGPIKQGLTRNRVKIFLPTIGGVRGKDLL